MFLTALALAFVGVLGTGIGLLASLIPSDLVAKRDHHQRIAKLWLVLNLEVARIRGSCMRYISLTEVAIDTMKQDPKGQFPVHALSRLTSGAGQAALSNGDFVAQTPDQIVIHLSRIYSQLDLVNALIDGYTIFTQTSRSLMNFGNSVLGYYETLNKGCSDILTELQPFQEEMEGQLKENNDEVARQQKRIQIAKWVSGVTFGIVFALVIIFFLLQVASPAQPLPTPTPTSTP